VPSGQTTVRQEFQKFRRRSFLFESHVRTVLPCHLDSCTFSASNFHKEASRVQIKSMVVWTADLMHSISISDARASRPCWLDLNCDICLMDERVLTGIHVVRTVATIFPYLCFGKKSWGLIEHWRSSGQDAELSRRMQARAVWSFSTQRKVQTGIHVVRLDDALVWCASERYATSFKRLAGNRIFWLANCTESSGNTSK
jgi:hypothetical protein